jgi:hypothetical protein
MRRNSRRAAYPNNLDRLELAVSGLPSTGPHPSHTILSSTNTTRPKVPQFVFNPPSVPQFKFPPVVSMCIMKGPASTPASNYLFNVNPKCKKLDSETAVIYHHLTAKLLYLAKRI